MHKVIPFLCLLTACVERPQVDTAQFEQYADIAVYITEQASNFNTQGLEKRVILNGEEETKTLKMDADLWNKELSFLEDIDPSKSEYVGAFDISESNATKTLTLKTGEKGILKSISYNFLTETIQATVLEEKDIYVYAKEITLRFDEGTLQTYNIEGYQKMLMSDTVFFSLRGEVLP